MAKVIGMDASAISPSTSREIAQPWGSMNHLRLINALEESFSIRLSMDEIEGIRSFADLSAAVGQHA